ncbi:hypothetical protein LC613_06725 [Nostoc sphaeroides CHAB 2801]|uniref:hypothetical protein n=1 Tax=Nostoc sphaeroides TaxID=446679 RepID=UPI000E4E6661|nr:hypothetical protein [Nostoc sphaeroides]MCC5627846.1 hypothetical protein [Nostoc sphaeroides CHAB 2801]
MRVVATDLRVVATDLGVVATDLGVVATDLRVVATDLRVVATDLGVVATDLGVVATDLRVVATDLRVVTTDLRVAVILNLVPVALLFGDARIYISIMRSRFATIKTMNLKALMTLAIMAEPAPLKSNKDGVVLVGKTRVTLDTVVVVFKPIRFS